MTYFHNWKEYMKTLNILSFCCTWNEIVTKESTPNDESDEQSK